MDTQRVTSRSWSGSRLYQLHHRPQYTLLLVGRRVTSPSLLVSQPNPGTPLALHRHARNGSRHPQAAAPKRNRQQPKGTVLEKGLREQCPPLPLVNGMTLQKTYQSRLIVTLKIQCPSVSPCLQQQAAVRVPLIVRLVSVVEMLLLERKGMNPATMRNPKGLKDRL